MTNISKELDIRDILSTRLWFYDFLGKSFYMEPEVERLKEVASLKIFDQFANEEDEISNLLVRFFNNISDLTDKDFKKLKEEYTRLFIGPGHLPAPPWESVYLSKERIIFDEHTLAVREFFKKWGVSTKGLNKEPDDHIGFELEFMSILIDKGIKALDENNIGKFKETMEAQKEFLEAHILLWVGEFSEILTKSTKNDYFKGLGLFLPEYLKMDYELLQDLILNLDDIQ